MQSLDVISVNIWQIIVALCNLVILFFILKKFLYKPVRNMFEQRKADLDNQYSNAERALKDALENKKSWEGKMMNADKQADLIIEEAKLKGEKKGNLILEESREKAGIIIKDAETQAKLEKKKAKAEIKKEIIDVSAALTEKMLEREITDSDHHAIINLFISEIGDNNDGDK